jgi:hypothetical protein
MEGLLWYESPGVRHHYWRYQSMGRANVMAAGADRLLRGMSLAVRHEEPSGEGIGRPTTASTDVAPQSG